MVRQTHIDPDGDVRLPPEVRDRFGWRTGDQLIIEERSDGMLLRRPDAGDDAASLGEAGNTLAAEVLAAEDFSGWEKRGG